MQVMIHNSVSLDGFICGLNGKEDWISEVDEKFFHEACEQADVIVLGSGTFTTNPELYPVPGKENVVFTQSAQDQEPIAGITFTDCDPVSYIKDSGHNKILVAGGGKLNATFLKAGVATDIVVCIHPIILGDGIKQFEGIDSTALTQLETLSVEDIGDGVSKIHYQIKN